MGFKSATQKGHRLNNLIFPSRQIYLIVNKINKKLELLYPSVRGSPEYDYIFDEVKEYIDEIKMDYYKIYIVETDDSAFGQEFGGIVDFFNEVFDMRDNPQIRNQTPKSIRERFIYIASELWGLGIHPSEI